MTQLSALLILVILLTSLTVATRRRGRLARRSASQLRRGGATSLFALLLASSSLASTLKYTITSPVWWPWFTASTYAPNKLVANTIINGYQWQNQGASVQVCPCYSGGQWTFTVTVYNVPSGVCYFAIARNNFTGALEQTNTVKASNPNETYNLGTLHY